MSNNGRYTINMYEDNSFHIKVNRNPKQFNPKLNSMVSSRHNLKQSIPHNYNNDKIPKTKKDALLLKRMSKHKNKLNQIINGNNHSKLLNRQKVNKDYNSEKMYQKNLSERGIIDALNNIRNNHLKLNNSNKINKSNSIISHLKGRININYNKNDINDYRNKINNNKNLLKNPLYKTSSYNNENKNKNKNLDKINSNTSINFNNYYHNNFLMDDTTSNDTDLLGESGNANINKETNLYVYRSEVQYPFKNITSNTKNLIKSNIPNRNININLKNLQDNNDYINIKNNNYILRTSNHDKYKNKIHIKLDNNDNQFENISKSLGSSQEKRSARKEDSQNSNYIFSPVEYKILSKKRNVIKNKNSQNMINSANNSIKIKKNLNEKYSTESLNYSNERIYNSRLNNNNNITNSCHHFYRKKYYSKDKSNYNTDNNNYLNDINNEYMDDIVTKKNKIFFHLNYKNNRFSNKYGYNNNNYSSDRCNKFLKKSDENKINNYKYFNSKRNYIIYQKYKNLSIFCDTFEKYLIYILKQHLEYFLSQLNKYIEIKNYKYENNYYEPDKDKKISSILLKRFNNNIKNKVKKAYYTQKGKVPLDRSKTKLDLSNYKKGISDIHDSKIYTFKIISRNSVTSDIYKKKSNSINKSLNLQKNKDNQNYINNKEEINYNTIKKRKNLSFNKIYIPKHKNPQYNKYKSLKINTKIVNNNDLNNNDEINDSLNNINNTDITNSKISSNRNIISHSNLHTEKVYKTINGNDSIIKKICHITALKRKYINNQTKDSNNSITINTSNNTSSKNNINNKDLNNMKSKHYIKNIYSKPLFKKIRKKILEKEMNNKKYNFNSAKKIDKKDFEDDKSDIINGYLSNSIKITNEYINEEKINNYIIKTENNKNENNSNKKKNGNNNNLYCNKSNIILTKKKINYSNNNSFINKSLENKNDNIYNNNNFIGTFPIKSIKIDNIKQEKNNENNTKNNININNNNKDLKNINKENISNKNIEKKNEENDINSNDDDDDDNTQNDNYNITRSIIVKDVCSRDRKLNVFIKYYDWCFPLSKTKTKTNNSSYHQLTNISTDSITLYNIKENKYAKKDEHKNNKYLQQILSSIIEEDEKSKANPSINNSNSVVSEEDSDKNNTITNNINSSNFTHNLVIYLTNILQNIYDDNRKMALYLFMRNFKRIQNHLYLKNSIMQFNSMFKNGINNNNVYNNDKKETTTCNGGNEVEVDNGGEKNSSKNLFFYTADNSLLDINNLHNNKNNILIGSLSFKDFEIVDEDNIIKPKKYCSSSSINHLKNNGTGNIHKRKELFNRKNKLKKIIYGINEKIIKNYFNFWKKINDNNNNNEYNDGNGYQNDYNYNIYNGMNISNRINGRNDLNEKIVEIHTDDLCSGNEVKYLDNGIDIEYEMEIKNTEINNEVLINNKINEMDKKLNILRNILIKKILKK